MKLPEMFHFLRLGWWMTHVLAIGVVGAVGFHLGSAHSGHGGEHAHAAAAPSGEHAHAAAAPSGENVVREEMRLLERALSQVPAHFASGDLRSIEHALHEVHGARERTAAAIQSGSYRPPRGGGQMERFMELDRDFHGQLEKLAGAAARNDPTEAGAALGGVLQGCQGCHAEYR